VKRFKIETSSIGKRFVFLSENKGSKLLAVSTHPEPQIEIKFQRDKKSDKETENILLSEFIDVKGWKATGNKLNYFKIFGITLIKTVSEEVLAKPVKGLAPRRVTKPAASDIIMADAQADVTTDSKNTEKLILEDSVQQNSTTSDAKPKKRQLNLF
ncbi:MAG: DNA gyrase/topoisomerase IV subunit A, partial [Bacteroidota bacterium]|nr:DNA gyrase/topoisomerase IV subunit A [Bacteroidota bacterium]